MAAARGTLGASIKRKEDRRLLTGAGRYVDDHELPGTLHVAFVRSPHAHALIRGIDLGPALAASGVTAAVTGAEVARQLGPLPSEGWKLPGPKLREAVDPLVRTETQHLLAVERAHYVGEPVAVVLATDRYLAEDAAEQVVVDWEPLPVVADVRGAAAPDAPRVHPELPDNLSTHMRLHTGDIDDAFARAERVVRRKLSMQRLTGIPIETRGTLARPEPDGRLMVWSATQTPHALRTMLAHVLGIDDARIRVIAPDVGGGFGIKGLIYPEELVVSWLALQHGVPIKWVEDRHEHFRAAIQSRDQAHAIELALDAEGHILGLRDRFTVDMGAYNPLGLVQPYNTSAHTPGPYRIPAIDIESWSYFTHKAPLAPYRGAGRPEAVFVMDRILDAAAQELQLDAAEIRRRNLIPAAEMPYNTGLMYRDGHAQIYDSGDYRACLDEALALIDYDEARREQSELWKQGVYRGIGLSAYVEGTGVGPFEGGSVRVDDTGHVWVFTGACSQGQSHETTFAQVAAEQLNLDVEQVTVVPGDTAGIARGWGTIASRSAVVAGTAIALASQDMGEQLKGLAAELLEAAAADLELHAGSVRVVGTPGQAVTFAQLAAHARTRGGKPPSAPIGGSEAAPEPAVDHGGAQRAAHLGASEPQGPERSAVDLADPIEAAAAPAFDFAGGAHAPEHLATSLEATRYFEPPTVTYANAVHAARVEVDLHTGVLRLLKYVVVHDCGKVINPLVVDGQITGGVAQGIGNALLEELHYDANGQLLTASLLDYLMPTAGEMPPLALGHQESPSPRNPLGLKGLGEGGCISPPAAIGNAVEDALRPLGVLVDRTPLTPERVLTLIEEAQTRGDQG